MGVDPERRILGLTPVASQPAAVYLASAAYNIRRFGTTKLRARAKTIGKAIQVAVQAYADEICALTTWAKIGSESMESTSARGTEEVPFIEIVLYVNQPDTPEEIGMAVAEDVRIIAVDDRPEAEQATELLAGICQHGHARFLLYGEGAYFCSKAIRLATYLAGRGAILSVSEALFGCTDGGEPFLGVPCDPSFAVLEDLTDNSSKTEALTPAVEVSELRKPNLGKVIAALAGTGHVWLRFNGRGISCAMATIQSLTEKNMIHRPHFAQLGALDDIDGTTPVMSVRIQATTRVQEAPRQLPAELEIIQVGQQNDAHYMLSIMHEALCTGRFLIRSRVHEPFSALKVARRAVETGLIRPPTEARLCWDQSTGFAIEVLAETRVELL